MSRTNQQDCMQHSTLRDPVQHVVPDMVIVGLVNWQISAPVHACGLSEDCRHLLAVLGNGYIFRFEYRKPTPTEELAAEPAATE